MGTNVKLGIGVVVLALLCVGVGVWQLAPLDPVASPDGGPGRPVENGPGAQRLSPNPNVSDPGRDPGSVSRAVPGDPLPGHHRIVDNRPRHNVGKTHQ